MAAAAMLILIKR